MNKNGKGAGKHNTSVITQSKGLQASDGDFFFLACKSIGNNLVFWLAAFFSREISNKFICHLQAGISHLHH